MSQASRRLRRNEVLRTSSEEGWRPIPCTEVTPLRRFFDLQAGSIWSDLTSELPGVRGTIVDVGCGSQPYRRLLSPDVSYIGIDFYDAPALFGYELPDTRYYDGEHWPINDSSVDTVLATETLEHVKEPAQFLNEAFRSLKPGGRLILTVPFSARLHFIPADYWRFTPSGLDRLLTSAGFRNIDVRARGNEVTVACYKVMALCSPLIMPQGVSRARAAATRVLGALTLPLFLTCALVAHLSFRSAAGDDCLGYTVTAEKPAER